jgi:hypothetical protein
VTALLVTVHIPHARLVSVHRAQLAIDHTPRVPVVIALPATVHHVQLATVRIPHARLATALLVTVRIPHARLATALPVTVHIPHVQAATALLATVRIPHALPVTVHRVQPATVRIPHALPAIARLVIVRLRRVLVVTDRWAIAHHALQATVHLTVIAPLVVHHGVVAWVEVHHGVVVAAALVAQVVHQVVVLVAQSQGAAAAIRAVNATQQTARAHCAHQMPSRAMGRDVARAVRAAKDRAFSAAYLKIANKPLAQSYDRKALCSSVAT